MADNHEPKCGQLSKTHAEELCHVKEEMRQKFDDERARLLNQILELTRMRETAGVEVAKLWQLEKQQVYMKCKKKKQLSY